MSSTLKIKHKHRKEFGGVSWGLNLPPPPNNDPYQITISTDCADPEVSATLTPAGGGFPIPGAVGIGNPIPVSWNVPDGDYTLSVTMTCDGDQTIITQDVTLSSAFAESKRKYE